MPEASQELLDFVDKARLREVGCYELFGARGGVTEDGSRAVVGPGRVGDIELEEEQELGVYWLSEGGRLLIRLRISLTGEAGELRAGIQAEYDVGDLTRDDVSPSVEEEYVNRVAVMTLVPYMREALSDISLRTFGNPITMGVVRPGEIAFSSKRTPGGSEEAVADAQEG